MKFASDEISFFSDKNENCLNNDKCREIFKRFLKDTNQRDLVEVVEIWEKANEKPSPWNSDDEEYEFFVDKMEENNIPVNHFEVKRDKSSYVKNKFVNKIPDEVRANFIKYLMKNHLKKCRK